MVQSILTNEKYKGDALLQKVYTTDYLSKKKKVNEGEVPQYYVEGNHPAIIDPAVFDRVQLLMKARCPGKNRISSVSIFSSKIKCGDCGSWYGSKVWHSNDKYRRVVWQCNHKFKGGEKCTTPHLIEDAIKECFTKAMNLYADQREVLIATFTEIEQIAFDTSDLISEQQTLQNEMNIVAEQIEQCIAENSRVAQDQDQYEVRYNALAEKFDRIKARLDAVTATIMEKQAQREEMRVCIETLTALPDTIDTFDEPSWTALLDYATVQPDGKIEFTFKSGTIITI